MQLLQLALVTPVLANATTAASSFKTRATYVLYAAFVTRAIGFTFLLPLVILHCVILSASAP